MDISNHIGDLLYHHDCVVVPGFGGFVTNERSARIDKSSDSFYPPSREVGFNARLDHNDGLLVSYLSARLSVKYVDAREMVRAFADDLHERLKAGKIVSFEGIGQFSADREGSLLFEPDPSANFLTDAYGLSFFRFPSLKEPVPVHGSEKDIIRSGSLSLSGRAKRLLRYAAIGIPIVVALGWGAMNRDMVREFSFNISTLNPFSAVVDSGFKNDRPVIAEVEVADEIEELDETAGPDAADSPGIPGFDSLGAGSPHSDSPDASILDEMSSQRRALMIGEQPVDQSPPEDTGPVEAETTDRVYPATTLSAHGRLHHIVAGSFTRRQNASVLIDSLSTQGYRPELIISDQGMFRVSLFSTGNRREALEMLNRVRAEAGRSDAWLLMM